MLKRLLGIEPSSRRASSPREPALPELPRRYYVYVLYIIHNGREVLLYGGKGTGGRMDEHVKILRRKLGSKKTVKLDAKERLMLLALDLGYTIYSRRVKTNLTETEAYNLENEVIREHELLTRGNVAFPHRIKKAASRNVSETPHH